MSLAGNLADLSLGDILQILNLSQKSGILMLDSDEDSLELLFVEGKLISMVPRRPREELGIFLQEKHRRPQDFSLIANVLESSPQASWNYLIQLYFQNPSTKPIDIAKEYLQWLMNKAYDTNKGSFKFSLGVIEKRLTDLATSGWVPIIKPGLNPQFLAIEAARASDESELNDLPARVAAQPGKSVNIDLKKAQLVVVDDNPKILEVLFSRLQAQKFTVAKMIRSTKGFQEWLEEKQGGLDSYVFLIDLVMPKLDRSGVLGGLDALAMLYERDSGAAAVLMLDVESEQIEEKVRASGASAWVKKGTRRAFREEPDVSADKLITAIAEALQPGEDDLGGAGGEADKKNNQDEKIDPFANIAVDFLTSEGSSDANDRPFDPDGTSFQLIEGLLEEMVEVDSASEIVLLILRFASEVLDRAVLLDLRDEYAYGRGQFGLSVREADDLVRRIKLPMSVDSIFRIVVSNRKGYQGLLSGSPVHQTFINIIGGGEVDSCFVCPLLADRRVIAILYGDNQPTGRALNNMQSMQIFLKQAGIAYEKALLREELRQRKL